MNKSIEIPQSEAAEYAEFLSNKLVSLNEKIASLLNDRKELESRIKTLLNGKVLPLTNTAVFSNGFEPNSTILGKISFILAESNEAMFTRGIINRLFEFQPELKEQKEVRQRTEKNVSTVLSINQGEGKAFKRMESPDGNTFTLNERVMA